MSHEIVTFENGEVSMRDLRSGEAMHSHIGPWLEANLVYVGQVDLQRAAARRLVVLDLGLGIAANVCAAIETVQAIGGEVEIWSVERDLAPLRAALADRGRFAWIELHRDRIQGLLAQGEWNEPGMSWRLVEAEFFEADVPVRAHAVFYDFYSPKANPELWTEAAFVRLRELCADDVVLATYCASSAVRRAMRAAGFIVRTGVSTSAKRETTVAFLHEPGASSSP